MDLYYPVPTATPSTTRCLSFQIPDSAEWVGLFMGALWELMRVQNYDTDSGQDVSLVIDRWLDMFSKTDYAGGCDMTPVGAIMIWQDATPPDRWLICDGTGHLKSEYPKLYALYGGRYNESVDHFGVPDYKERSPFGTTFNDNLDEAAGAMTHTLTITEMPAHTHDHIRPGGAAGGGYTNVTGVTNSNPVNVAWPTQSAGGGQAHNNLHPVRRCHFIVYAG